MELFTNVVVAAAGVPPISRVPPCAAFRITPRDGAFPVVVAITDRRGAVAQRLTVRDSSVYRTPVGPFWLEAPEDGAGAAAGDTFDVLAIGDGESVLPATDPPGRLAPASVVVEGFNVGAPVHAEEADGLLVRPHRYAALALAETHYVADAGVGPSPGALYAPRVSDHGTWQVRVQTTPLSGPAQIQVRASATIAAGYFPAARVDIPAGDAAARTLLLGPDVNDGEDVSVDGEILYRRRLPALGSLWPTVVASGAQGIEFDLTVWRFGGRWS